MADSSSDVQQPQALQQLPAVLDGKFFTVTAKKDDGKIVAKCMTCFNKSISGTVQSTSNFIRHLKVGTTTTRLSRLELFVRCTYK